MKIVVIKKNGTLCDLDWKKNIDLKDVNKLIDQSQETLKIFVRET